MLIGLDNDQGTGCLMRQCNHRRRRIGYHGRAYPPPG